MPKYMNIIIVMSITIVAFILGYNTGRVHEKNIPPRHKSLHQNIKTLKPARFKFNSSKSGNSHQNINEDYDNNLLYLQLKNTLDLLGGNSVENYNDLTKSFDTMSTDLKVFTVECINTDNDYTRYLLGKSISSDIPSVREVAIERITELGLKGMIPQDLLAMENNPAIIGNVLDYYNVNEEQPALDSVALNVLSRDDLDFDSLQIISDRLLAYSDFENSEEVINSIISSPSFQSLETFEQAYYLDYTKNLIDKRSDIELEE